MLFWRGGERHLRVVRMRFAATAASPWMGTIMYSSKQRMYTSPQHHSADASFQAAQHVARTAVCSSVARVVTSP